MSFLLTFLRVLAILFLIRLALRFFVAVVQGYRGVPAAAPPRGVDMVRDRVCNTFLPRGRALRAVVGGHEEHFCSPACRDRALAAFRPT